MERLTKRIEGLEEASLSCEKCGKAAISECWSQENCTQTAVDRLSAIEDILGDDYDLDRLRELVEADRGGRCVVYQNGYPVASHYYQDEDGLYIREVSGVVSKEEYEAALKGEQNAK